MENKIIRAAVYTRKSSEEGLEQEFNSLDAQREACKAYIASQKHEGWVLVEKDYSDGGISGGTLNRPAIQELLQDIKDGLVNMIVVYKIDRLTRSLHDFSKLVEIFDAHNASFVSITQQFNTSTSMGRLTLNMMLSFAQFEREIAGERVRDKKLASAKKGLWVYGKCPFGYTVEGGILKPDPVHRETVALIFSAYLKLKSVPRLYFHLKEKGVFTKTGKAWCTGNLYNMLSRQVYTGKLPYKDQLFEGLHQAIISKEVFAEAQAILRANNKSHRIKSFAKEASPLAGLLFDENGNKFYPSHSTKKTATPRDGGSAVKGRDARERLISYRYYINKALLKPEAEFMGKIRQISAEEIERTLSLIFRQELENTLPTLKLSSEHRAIVKDKINTLTKGFLRPLYLKAIDKITLLTDRLEIHFYSNGFRAILQEFAFGTEVPIPKEDTYPAAYPISLTRGYKGSCLIHGEIVPTGANREITEAVRRSFLYHKLLLEGAYPTVKDLAQSLGFSDSKQTRKILKLRSLAADILTRILKNQIPIHWRLSLLWRASEYPDWDRQRKFLA